MSFAQEIAEQYLPHEARVEYPKDWIWPGKPWPWCAYAERTHPDWPGQRVEDWPVVQEAIPHDAHIDNGGNTRCPGVPGIVAGKRLRDLEKDVERREMDLHQLRQRVASGERSLEINKEALEIVRTELRKKS